MASERERIASLETHYEHVDKTLEAIRAEIRGLRTEMDGVRQMVHSDSEAMRAELGGRLDDILLRLADDKAADSETKLKVALKVIGWLVGVVTTVLGTVIGGLFVFARFLLPKLAAAAQDAASAIT